MAAAYEDLLNRQVEWALHEGSMHFEERSAVHVSLRRITARLRELAIPHALVGGMALFFHGLRRFTEDVDILVTPEGLRRIHEELEGHGYLPLFPGSRGLRDTESGVRIEFLVTGEFPGDGKPKPLAFPDPNEVGIQQAGLSLIALKDLVALKLASGTSSPGRLRDLADVQELIRVLDLPPEFSQQLPAFVREKFRELCSGVQEERNRQQP